jgi:hypothetical protein
MANTLTATMTLRDFEHGYWYLEELKPFAERIGIPAARKLRKDELERAIVAFLRTGRAALPTKRPLRRTGVKDVQRGLTLRRRIEHYTSNRETKDFIIEQANRMAPQVRAKSGVWYRTESLARSADHEWQAADVWRPRPAVHRPEPRGALRENSSGSLHQLSCGFSRREAGRHSHRGHRRLVRTEGARRPKNLCGVGEGTRETGHVNSWLDNGRFVTASRSQFRRNR